LQVTTACALPGENFDLPNFTLASLPADRGTIPNMAVSLTQKHRVFLLEFLEGALGLT
jgi:hypothetical protein